MRLTRGLASSSWHSAWKRRAGLGRLFVAASSCITSSAATWPQWLATIPISGLNEGAGGGDQRDEALWRLMAAVTVVSSLVHAMDEVSSILPGGHAPNRHVVVVPREAGVAVRQAHLEVVSGRGA